jgi:hypothetical protein
MGILTVSFPVPLALGSHAAGDRKGQNESESGHHDSLHDLPQTVYADLSRLYSGYLPLSRDRITIMVVCHTKYFARNTGYGFLIDSLPCLRSGSLRRATMRSQCPSPG